LKKLGLDIEIKEEPAAEANGNKEVNTA